MERMKQAAWDLLMERRAGDNSPDGGAMANFEDLHKLIKEQDKNHLKLEKTDKKENKPPHTAAVQAQGFADLLMLIEKGGPGIPSEIGLRLYSSDGVVSRVSGK